MLESEGGGCHFTLHSFCAFMISFYPCWRHHFVSSLTTLHYQVEGRDKARNRLALLLAQAGKDSSAAAVMRTLGYRYRLARCVLHYNTVTKLPQTPYAPSVADKYVRAFDSALPIGMLKHLQVYICISPHLMFVCTVNRLLFLNGLQSIQCERLLNFEPCYVDGFCRGWHDSRVFLGLS